VSASSSDLEGEAVAVVRGQVNAAGQGGDEGTIAYVVSFTADSITAVDISNPSALSELDSLSSANLDGAGGVALDLTNQVAYVACATADSITAVDISNPSALSELDSLSSANLDGANIVALNIEGSASTNAYE